MMHHSNRAAEPTQRTWGGRNPLLQFTAHEPPDLASPTCATQPLQWTRTPIRSRAPLSTGCQRSLQCVSASYKLVRVAHHPTVARPNKSSESPEPNYIAALRLSEASCELSHRARHSWWPDTPCCSIPTWLTPCSAAFSTAVAARERRHEPPARRRTALRRTARQPHGRRTRRCCITRSH